MHRICLPLAILSFVAYFFTAKSHAQQAELSLPATVTVRLASGRTFVGQLDPRTSDRQLWLRMVYGQAVVLRPVDWEKIEAINAAGKTHTAEEFRELAGSLQQATPRAIWPQQPGMTGRHLSGPWTIRIGMADTHRFTPSRVKSLHAAVQLSNWDADAPADGFAVTVAPLSDFGELLPVEGVVEATLFGYDHRNGLPLEHWSPLARWSQSLTSTCYGPEGGLLRLPFADVPTELGDFHSPRRMLRVRLAAPGHGTFESEVPLMAARRGWPQP